HADVPMATDVVVDVVTSALLDEEEFTSQRQVILEELAMTEDDPGDVAHERFSAQLFGTHPLGRPTGGTPHTTEPAPRPAAYQPPYTPAELVVTAAGGVDHDALCEQVLTGVRRGGWRLDENASPASRRANGEPFTAAVAAGPGMPTTGSAQTVRRSTEQANIL